MAKKAGLAQKMFVGNFDVSADIASVEQCSTPVAVLDVTAIDKSATERLHGLVSGTCQFTSYFNDAAAAAHLGFRAPSTDVGFSWFIGQTVGDAVFMMDAQTVNYDPTRGADGALTFNVEANTKNNVPVWGVALTAGAITHTEATNGTTLDQGAQTSAGAEAILHVTSFTGSNFTATVQDSSNGSSWGTLKAFTQVTGVGNERVTVSGTVERYVRVISTGTFNPVTFAVSFRRGAATDRVTYS